MKKIKFILVAILLSVSSKSVLANDVNFDIIPPQINAETYVLMDYYSGTILAALNPEQRQYPASLTKMMTSYVLGDAIKQGKIRPSDMVTISESAWGKNFPGSSKMFLNLNQQVSVADLNQGIIVVSANDACVAIAEHMLGSTQRFVDLMNKYVNQFGLKNTHFTTPHGLDDPQQYSSARDMAIIGSRIIRDLPEEYKIYAQKEFTFNKIKQLNRNGLLWDKSFNVDGMKTGHTDQAGYNLVASATNDSNMRLISVVMGVSSHKGREVESKKLLQWGFNQFQTFKTLEAGKNIEHKEVYYGRQNKVAIGVLQEGFVTIPKGRQADVKVRLEYQNKLLEAPLAKGQIVGRIIYQLDGKEINSFSLHIMQDAEQAGIFGRAWDWLKLNIKDLL